MDKMVKLNYEAITRDMLNGGDVDAYRRAIKFFGTEAKASSRDKRATFRGSLTPFTGKNRKQRRAENSGKRGGK